MRIRVNERHGRVIEFMGAAFRFFRGHLFPQPHKTRRVIWWEPVRRRNEIEADLVRANCYTAWFRLPDGNVIKRKEGRDYGTRV